LTSRAELYFHTLRHLRLIQVAGRLWFKLSTPTPTSGTTPPTRTAEGPWKAPARRRRSMCAPMLFEMLNETRRVPEGDWSAPSASDLWRYNLHYFDDLNAQGAEARRRWHEQAIEDWIRSNPPAVGTGWEPYPTSLRVVNWIKYALGGQDLSEQATASLATQTRFLRQRLEYHLLGNHLFANAKALVFAGAWFDGGEAGTWLHKGLSILEREIPEQILPDGGQFERSPMYHALALEDVLDLINLARAYPAAIPDRWRLLVHSWPDAAQRMIRWLDAMCHPDGEIALFNDAAFGIAPAPNELRRYAHELLGDSDATLPRLVHLADSGYVRATARDAVLIADVAPIGPDYLPGHAHADTLSFELSLFGQRTIVNGGTSRYGTGPEREAERGTPAHSTVTVDGENSSEVWAGFRVARRAKPFDLKVEDRGDEVHVSCAHDGYRRLRGKPVHRRAWRLRDGELRVEDRIEGTYRTAHARYHLHPSVEAMAEPDGRSGALKLPGGQQVRWQASAPARIEPSSYAPEFGLKLGTRCLVLELRGAEPASLELSW